MVYLSVTDQVELSMKVIVQLKLFIGIAQVLLGGCYAIFGG